MSYIEEQTASNYRIFRGRCKELCDAECKRDPTLTLVRGNYWCPMWNRSDPHWWCVSSDGSIHDPSKDQFPSRGMGIYTPFDGLVSCSECGKEMTEEEAIFESNYAFCSSLCYGRFVGVA